MKKKNITKNYLFNMMYEVFLLLTPILVTPYVSRVLTSSGVGQYSFTFSIVSYFVSFANFGFVFYSQREIAKHQEDKEKQKLIFWELVICRGGFVLGSLIVYLILVFSGTFDIRHQSLLLFLSLNIISVLFDITFLFKGNDLFGKIVLRNIVIRLIGIVAIFLLVKTPNDVWLYTLIQSGMLILGAVSLWPFLPKGFFVFDWSKLEIKKHILPAAKLFLPALAGSLYAFLDKSLLGIILKSDIDNGMYEQAEKMVKMCLTVITSLSAIMITRNANEYSKGNQEQLRRNVEFTMGFCFLLGIPLSFGIAAVSGNFSPWYFGMGYADVPLLMRIFAPIIFVSGMSTVLGQSYFVAIGEDNKFIATVIFGALINLVLNIILIPLWRSAGAAVATVFSEIFQLILLLVFARKTINFVEVLKENMNRVIAGGAMFLVCWGVQLKLQPSFINTVLITTAGILVYLVLLFITKDSSFKLITQRFKKG